MSSESANDRAAVEGRRATDGAATSDDGASSLFAPSIRRFPWRAAGLAGGLTFLIQYVFVAMLVVVHPGVSTAADTLVEQLKTYGLILFNAHAVPIIRVVNDVNYQGPTRLNLIADATAIPPLVYYAIPVVALLAAGALLERYRTGTEEGVLEGSALVGTGLITGYFVVGMLASFAVATTTTYGGGSVTEGVDLVFAFAATVGYPLVVGSVGALAVRTYRTHVA